MTFTNTFYFTRQLENQTRNDSSRMRTDHSVTRPSSESVSMRPIVDRQTPVKTLPSPALGNYSLYLHDLSTFVLPHAVCRNVVHVNNLYFLGVSG